MQIFVRTLTNSSITLDVEVSESVTSVLAKVHDKQGIPPEEQRLVYCGRQLEEGTSLADYHIGQDSTLDLQLRLRGGHCQVPCGIFDDPKLIADLKEAIATIKKAVEQIGQLSASINALNLNQMTRWVNTKDEHASKIIEWMTEYCLCQRIKPVGDPKSPFKEEAEYIAALQIHHAVMMAAVVCKQSVTLESVNKLEAVVLDVSKIYLPASKY